MIEQARGQVEMTTGPIDGFPADHATGFTLLRSL